MSKHNTVFVTVNNWVNQSLKYPVMEIYGGKNLEKTKEEKRVEKVCEEIFKFNFNTTERNIKQEVRETFRQLCVAVNLRDCINMKEEYLVKCKEDFLLVAKDWVKLLDETYKKEPKLKEYYDSWKIKYQDLKNLVYGI